MNSLPKELQTIIIDYKYQIEYSNKMKEIVCEIKEKSYYCGMCYENLHETICPIFKECNCCKQSICEECKDSFTDGNDGDECDDCFFHCMIYSNVESIINRSYQNNEHTILCDVLFDIGPYEKEELCDFLYENFEFIIDSDIATMTFSVIFLIIQEFIENNFN